MATAEKIGDRLKEGGSFDQTGKYIQFNRRQFSHHQKEEYTHVENKTNSVVLY